MQVEEEAMEEKLIKVIFSAIIVKNIAIMQVNVGKKDQASHSKVAKDKVVLMVTKK